MAENTQYFESITGRRAIAQYDEQTALEGGETVSLECQGDLVEDDYLTYIQENLPQFLRLVRWLTREEQELLLSYYLLSKTQNALALIHLSTQTIMSFRLRMAMKKLGAFMLFGGVPTVEQMSSILAKAGLETVTVCSDRAHAKPLVMNVKKQDPSSHRL
jgi:hypothetical protein